MTARGRISVDSRDSLEAIALEISELRDALRELSRQALRIERRVAAALPARQERKTANGKASASKGTAQEQLAGLTERAMRGEQIENDLRKMKVKGELEILARQLGMTNRRLPPKDDLVRRISTRLRQSASVTAGIRAGLRGDREYSGL